MKLTSNRLYGYIEELKSGYKERLSQVRNTSDKLLTELENIGQSNLEQIIDLCSNVDKFLGSLKLNVQKEEQPKYKHRKDRIYLTTPEERDAYMPIFDKVLGNIYGPIKISNLTRKINKERKGDMKRLTSKTVSELIKRRYTSQGKLIRRVSIGLYAPILSGVRRIPSPRIGRRCTLEEIEKSTEQKREKGFILKAIGDYKETHPDVKEISPAQLALNQGIPKYAHLIAKHADRVKDCKYEKKPNKQGVVCFLKH